MGALLDLPCSSIILWLSHSVIILWLCHSVTFEMKIFVTLFLGIVRPRKLEVNSGCMYHVYLNQAAAAYSFLYFFIFFLSNFQMLKIFVTPLSGTVRCRKLKLGTHMDSGWMYHVYWNQAHPFIHFSLQFSNIKSFRHPFRRNCEDYKVETGQWVDVSCSLKTRCCCVFIPWFLHFSFPFQKLKNVRHTFLWTVMTM